MSKKEEWTVGYVLMCVCVCLLPQCWRILLIGSRLLWSISFRREDAWQTVRRCSLDRTVGTTKSECSLVLERVGFNTVLNRNVLFGLLRFRTWIGSCADDVTCAFYRRGKRFSFGTITLGLSGSESSSDDSFSDGEICPCTALVAKMRGPQVNP